MHHRTVTRTVAVVTAAIAIAAGCGHSKKSGPPGPSTITVHGVLEASPNGGKIVTIDDEPVTTGADGSFTKSGVPVPYRLAFLDPDCQTVVVYDGVTRSDPTIFGCFVQPLFATMSGTLAPFTSGTHAAVLFDATASTLQFPGGYLSDDGVNFNFQPHWNDNDPIDGTLRAVRYLVDSTSGAVTAFFSTGELPMPATQNYSTIGNLSITMVDGPATASGSVSITAAPGWHVVGTQAAQLWHRSELMNLASSTTSGQLTFLALAEPESGVRVSTMAVPDSAGTAGFVDATLDYAPNVGVATITLPRAITLTAPAAGATFSSGMAITFDTPFGATASYDTIFAGGGLAVEFHSNDGTLQMPALSPFGVSVAPGSYHLRVDGSDPGRSVDDQLSLDHLPIVSHIGSHSIDTNFTVP